MDWSRRTTGMQDTLSIDVSGYEEAGGPTALAEDGTDELARSCHAQIAVIDEYRPKSQSL
ncbi:hypothetical protein MY4824_004761 [Beauveria thailandica]